jgi:hypothetical protein
MIVFIVFPCRARETDRPYFIADAEAASFAEGVTNAEDEVPNRLLFIAKIGAMAQTWRQWNVLILERLKLSAMGRFIFHESAARFTIRSQFALARRDFFRSLATHSVTSA